MSNKNFTNYALIYIFSNSILVDYIYYKYILICINNIYIFLSLYPV